MNNIIEIKQLNFKYDDNKLFDKLDLNIEKGSFTTLIGENNSGKSTLAKILVGIINTDCQIKINNLELNKRNIKKIRNIIGYVPSDIGDSIITDTVLDEILLSSNKIITQKLNKILEDFGLNEIKNKNPKDISGGERQLVSIISQIVKEPEILIFDDSFSMLDNLTTDKILKLLKKICKENKMTILNITNDMEQILYGNKVAILSNGKILTNDIKENVVGDDKLLKKLNLKIPFMAELSLKLKYYNLINSLELDMDKMVNKLWK